MTGKMAITGMRKVAQRSATASSWSTVWRLTPGIDATGTGAPLALLPASCTKHG